MSKRIARIPLSEIDRVEIRVTHCRKSLAQVKQETGADYILNGGMWNGDGSACPLLKAGGVWYSERPWSAYGYAWDQGPDIALTAEMDRENLLACTCLIGPWGPVESPSYDRAQGGRRGRSAMGIQGGALCLYCSRDGSSDAETPEGLRDELRSLGWESAVMLDGGGSSQCDFKGLTIKASRKVHNWICVYRKKGGVQTPPDKEEPMGRKTVCLDPGHGPGTANGSPDGTYKEREFAWDMYERIRPLLEERGVRVICTRTEDTKPSLTERAGVSNRAGADCFVSLHSNAAGSGGWASPSGLEVYTSAGPMTARRNVLAAALVNAFHAAGVSLRQEPIKHNGELTVLIKTSAPAVLIEYGFHTNKTDVEYLKDGKYRARLTEATARGICEWLRVPYDVDNTVDEADKPDPWAADSWQKAKDKGVLDGTRPRDSLTRQELAAVLDRVGLL